MIYAVTEWCNQNEHNFFLFDENKVDPSRPFEVAYLKLLEQAAASSSKDVQTGLPGVLQERCGNYQDTMPCWEALHATLPCQIDAIVTVWAD